MSVVGKGFFIWKVRDCENGDPNSIVKVAQEAGLRHVLVKIADGVYPYNFDRTTKKEYAKPVIDTLKHAGISVWGWHYVYGDYPTQEANVAISRLKGLDLDGYVIDAEIEYKEPGKDRAASKYMDLLRGEFPKLPMALSSYRFPSYHPQLPWKTFLEKCDFNMPQVYWEQSHNAEANLQRTVKEFEYLKPNRPIIPTGPTYRAGSWVPKPDDLSEFMDTAKTLNLSAVNFFSWDECRPAYPNLWKTIQDYEWEKKPKPADITDNWLSAMNAGNIDQLIKLYHKVGVHITSDRSIQGINSIQSWYQDLFKQLPEGKYQLTHVTGSGATRSFSWTCKANGHEVYDGKDTLGLINGKIIYHYTSFSIKK